MKNQSVKIFVKETNVNFHNWCATADGFSHSIFKKYVGMVLPNWVMKIENDSGQWGVVEKEWEKLGNLFAHNFNQRKINIFGVEKDHYNVGSKIKKIVKEILAVDLKKAATPKLLAWLKVMWPEYHFLNGVGYVAVVSDFGHNFLTNKLNEILTKRNPKPEDLNKFFSLLMSPNKQTLFWQENLALLKLCKKYKTLDKLASSKEFKVHQQKWFWLNYGYQGPIWTEADFKLRAKDMLKNKNLDTLIKSEEKYFIELKRKQRVCEKKLELNLKEKYCFETARLFTFLKGYRIEIRHLYSYALDSIFAELGRRLHLPISFFRYATKEEIVKVVKEGKIKNRVDILNRRRSMLYLLENLKGRFVKQKDIDKIFTRLVKEEKIEKTDTVSGQIAYPGKVNGRVKILHSVKDINKVKIGDIIVAFGTIPDFLPAMGKAAAFVTDQGGITSHAAIIAREMKKPCVIGTKIATKVLKDGDIVEVDADNGIVKKL